MKIKKLRLIPFSSLPLPFVGSDIGKIIVQNVNTSVKILVKDQVIIEDNLKEMRKINCNIWYTYYFKGQNGEFMFHVFNHPLIRQGSYKRYNEDLIYKFNDDGKNYAKLLFSKKL